MRHAFNRHAVDEAHEALRRQRRNQQQRERRRLAKIEAEQERLKLEEQQRQWELERQVYAGTPTCLKESSDDA